MGPVFFCSVCASLTQIVSGARQNGGTVQPGKLESESSNWLVELLAHF